MQKIQDYLLEYTKNRRYGISVEKAGYQTQFFDVEINYNEAKECSPSFYSLNPVYKEIILQ